ncbi:MAG: glycosyltransferase [Alphaproteobacteria bacterium]|nr:glycosyltransferase [Alphaproteobacteria bacterium]
MRIAFVNPNLAHDYDVDTPFDAPLPGSESAQVYLAIALAKRGHDVAVFSGTSRAPGKRRGVFQDRWAGNLSGAFDAVFLTSAADEIAGLRANLGDTPIWAWQHNVFVPGTEEEKALKNLKHPRDRIMCVSNWHAANYKAYGVDGERIDVLRNAIGPRFETLFEPGESIVLHKRTRAAFTSVPYKGLRQALSFFKTLHAARPELVLDVFSSFDFYPPNNLFRHQPSWMMLQTEAKLSPGVVYHGNVPQPQLAEALKKALLLFYPNVAAETSSIAVMEAMAAGCVVITTAMGALPETVGEHGILAPVVGNNIDPDAYIGAARAIAAAFADDDQTLAARLRKQVDWVTANYRWDIRAAECEALIKRPV